MRWLLLVTLGCFAPLVDSTRAEACSCVPPTLSRQVLPADGATEVPTDASIRVFLRGFPEVARQALAGEYRLRDADGAVVPLRAALVRTRLDLTPIDRLAPAQPYVLEQLFAYDDEGTRLTDDERARPGAPLRAAWFPVARFTTAAGPGPGRSLAPTLGEVFLGVLHGGGDCGPATSLHVDLGPRVGARSTDLVELRVAGQGVVATAPLDGLDAIGAGDTLCTLDPITLRPGASLDFEVAYLDLAGRRLGRARGIARTRARRPDSARPEPSATWRPLDLVSTPAAAVAPGPPSCPHGLEVRAPSLVARGGMHDAWSRGAAFTASSAGRWLFASGRGRPALRGFSWVRGSPRAHDLSPPARVGAALGTPIGPLVVLQRVVDTEPRVEPTPSVHAFTPRLRAWWTRGLPAGDAHALAHGEGRVLVVWRERVEGAEHLAYALLDERTGVGAARSTAIVLDRGGTPPRVAFVAGRFFVFWRPRSGAPIRFAPIGADGALGTERALPLDVAYDFDVASAEDHLGVVASHEGAIRFAVLDGEGELLGAPVALSRGAGSSNVAPRVVWMDGRFVVGWHTFPETEAFFTVVDRQGRAAPPLALDDDARFELVAGADGVWAARASWRDDLRVLGLDCRTTPFDGPPRTIAPGRARPGSAPVDEDVIPPRDRRTAPVRRPPTP